MTRLLYLPDDATLIQVEVSIPAAELCSQINSGMRPAAVLRAAPPGRLNATIAGTSVIVLPEHLHCPPRNAAAARGLSRRQKQVYELSTRGLTSGEIALILHISRRTVNYHLSNARNQIK